MKKMFITVLLVLSLLCSCAIAEDSFSMTALYQANELDQLLKQPGDSMSQRSTQEDENGTLEYAYYVQLDENGALTYAYDSDMFLIVIKNGQGYAYDYTTEQPSMLFYIGDTYDKDIEDMRSSFPLMHYGDTTKDDEHVTSVETKNASLVVTADFEGSPDDETLTNRMVYTVDAETLVLQALKYEYINADDNVVSNGASTYTMGETYTVDPSIEALWSSEEMRTVTYIIDPGTEQENTQTFELPINVTAQIVYPEGYTIYQDSDCTIEATEIEPDADGRYAPETTLYITSIQ